MAEVDSLLPKVDLYRLSAGARQEISDLVAAAVTHVLRQLGTKRANVAPAALKVADAARYLGIGRSTFYSLLKADTALMAASFQVGTCRVWAVEVLDDWLRANRGRQILTNAAETRGSTAASAARRDEDEGDRARKRVRARHPSSRGNP